MVYMVWYDTENRSLTDLDYLTKYKIENEQQCFIDLSCIILFYLINWLDGKYV